MDISKMIIIRVIQFGLINPKLFLLIVNNLNIRHDIIAGGLHLII